MKKLLRLLFRIYHLTFASNPVSCRFNPTCSQYLLDATEKFGVLKGLYLSAKRVLACNPFSKRPFFDPA